MAGKAILDFYSGSLPDDRGRYLQEIHGWPDDTLEAAHDYIQWLFPLEEPSGANPDAPVLDPSTIAVFRANPELQNALRQSLLRMLQFYGLALKTKNLTVAVEPAAAFKERAKVWLRPGNHNHLRITRILKSVRTLGLQEEGSALFDELMALYATDQASTRRAISESTLRFWKNAAGR